MSNEPQLVSPDEQVEFEATQYIQFRLGGRPYGTPLLDVHEIIQPQPLKPIPNAEDYFLGLLNLRGQIVGIVDLRLKFHVDPNVGRGNAILVFTAGNGLMGAMVDEITQVIDIPKSAIDPEPTIEANIPMPYISGVAKQGNELIPLLDLAATIDKTAMLATHQSKLHP